MIKTEALSKLYRSDNIETRALHKISVHISEGEFVAFMGPSGCGKSTLLNLIGLLDTPSGGNYLLDGVDTGKLDEKQRTRFRKGKIGFVFQAFNLIDGLTAYENVEIPLIALGMKYKQRREIVMNTLENLKIGHRRRHFPQQLSGGQQQRIAFARAIVGNPKLILADEPTGNLDSKNGLEVMNLLSDLNKAGTSVLMVTHSQRDASFAQRIIQMQDGEFIAN
jgi:putative ABC transport system ATP-binding protein